MDREVQPQPGSPPPWRGTYRLNLSQGTKYAADNRGRTKPSSSSVQAYIHIKTNKRTGQSQNDICFFCFLLK